jgi:hypothetical protein
MTQFQTKALISGSLLLAGSFCSFFAAPAKAENSVATYPKENAAAQENAAMGQVTSVSQLSDVKPTDWAFQALQSLVERYGCIAGYPDRTYRGNRALTRYEFAAGLNACLDRVNELIETGTANLVKKEDLAAVQKLQEQFAAELATLKGRVDGLETKTATLEKQQFSTTTKLTGEAIFAISDEFGSNIKNNTVFQDRVRLSLVTSFNGEDQLYTRLAAGNSTLFSLPEGNAEGIQVQSLTPDFTNKVSIDWVGYYGKINNNLKFYLAGIGGGHYDYQPTANPILDSGDSGNGTLSYFAQRNPIYTIGAGSGAGLTYDAGKLTLSAGYFADNSGPAGAPIAAANNPTKGLFNGSYSAMTQLTYKPFDAFILTLNYVNAFRQGGGIFDVGAGGTGFLGTTFANKAGDAITGPLNNSAKVNAFGAAAALKVSPKLTVNGFLTKGTVNFIKDGQGKSDLWSYGLGLALPDLGKTGNLLAVVIGAEPYRPVSGAKAIPMHVEAFYKYQISDRVTVTPGLIWVTNPGQRSNSDALIGTVRTTFTF